MRRVVVVGGSVAAVNAVDGLRHAGFDGSIHLVSAEEVLPYDRPPLSKEALREGHGHDSLLIRDAQWYVDMGVDVMLGRAAVGLDPRGKTVTIEGGAELGYDGLVLATGSRPRRLDLVADMPEVYEIRSLADSQALHERLQPGRHLVVIGAGFIGLEVAATASKMGVEVSIVETAPVPLTRVLGSEPGRWFVDYHAQHGVRLHCGVGVDRVERGNGGTSVLLKDGSRLTADVIVAGVGVTPATDWLVGSGVALDDGVVCDSALRTSVPGVVAAGDLVRWHNTLFGHTMRIEQWLNAVEQGTHAARSLIGDGAPFAPVPYFWSDQFDAKVKFVGTTVGADKFKTLQAGDAQLVVVFGRGDRLTGALCINAPRQLAINKRRILTGFSWQDVCEGL